jgi:hypothetical protein
MSDWTDNDETVMTTIDLMIEDITKCPEDCSELDGVVVGDITRPATMLGYCDVCAIRADYITALRAILRGREPPTKETPK